MCTPDARLEPGFRRLDDERLSDLDCSNERLLLALRESAASAGGELLVGAHCGWYRSRTDARDAIQLECEAEVARYEERPARQREPTTAERAAFGAARPARAPARLTCSASTSPTPRWRSGSRSSSSPWPGSSMPR